MVSFNKMLTKVFGSRNERLLKRYLKIVEQVNGMEASVGQLSDEQLRQRTQELRQQLIHKKVTSEEVMPEAFAIIREAMDRQIGIRAIFNPDENFDPDKFDDRLLEMYDSVQRQMIQTGESWKRVPIPHEIYAAVRKLYPESRPPFRARCFDVQLIGGLVLYEGRIAEMATGEGKTFVAPLACFMRALEGMHCHVVTVNDYLVRRDAEWIQPAFEQLGLTVGFIQQSMEPGGPQRRKMYECDVTYGMNSEFGFDYLRDNMKEQRSLQVQGPLDFAVVDEVDSILIDEARTPLIISGAARDDAQKYRAADVVARKVLDLARPYDNAQKEVDAAKRAMKGAQGDLEKAKTKEDKESIRKRMQEVADQLDKAEAKKVGLVQYYEVELDRKSVHLTHEGIAAAQEAAGVGSFYVGNNMEWPHLMEQSLRAHVVYERDKDYVIERGQRGEMEVVIVDEYTGRKMVGRQWSDGLHQAVEAKERVPIKQETQTLATITLQNFFKLYKGLSGMTGTAQTEAEEFAKIYKLEVVSIPTNRPVQRQDNDDRVYRSEPEKWNAILEEIKEFCSAGRPVLVGTTSVEKSEMLSKMLTRTLGIQHEVLNAKNHEREAQIVLLAGQQHENPHGETIGNVTIATNMAGRGTDIKLSREAYAAGGLHVIGTERHTARRIDNQLRGRSGRQGDPGSSRFYVSLQDELMKMFAGDMMLKVLGWIGLEEGMAIEDKRVTKAILRAQKKVEERNYLARKNLLEYDEVNDNQRTHFYGMRQRVLEGFEISEVIWDMIGDAINDAVQKYIVDDYVAAVIAEWARTNFDVNLETRDFKGMRRIEDLEDFIKDQARHEAGQSINATLGEFMGDEPNDSSQWDLSGLSSWAMSKYQVQLSQSQIRKMDSRELEEQLRDAAIQQINKRECGGLLKYLEPLYPQKELAEWAREKFFIELDPNELVSGQDQSSLPAESIIKLIETRARNSYARREVEYPVDHLLTFAFGSVDASADNAYAADFVRSWARAKFGVDLTLEHIRDQGVRKLRDELIGYQENFLSNGKLESEVDRLIAENGDRAKLIAVFNQRFNQQLTDKDLEPRPGTDEPAPNVRQTLLKRARQFLRKELTDLEQFVMIQIFDQTWKDHLYAMDILKTGIGLQSFAEKDPRVLYKKEGYEFFERMLASIRDKVTDLIFKARVEGATPTRSAYRVTSTVHEEPAGYGVAETVPAGEAEEAPVAQGEVPGKVATIVRDTPKVGRNDLCPCGSGKKYKKCCGENA